MEKGKVLTLEDRIPKLKQQRRQKANRRLIFSVSIFFLLIISILYLQSPLSHIVNIEVTGNIHVPSEEIISLSGLSNRTSFWSVKADSVIKKIKKNQEIKEVNIERKFPNSVIISVTEMKRVAYAMNSGGIVPILENGTILEINEETMLQSDAPILMNWETGSTLQEMAGELAKLKPAITNSISEVHHTPQESDPYQITLYMNDGFEVRASITDFAKKMSAYPAIVNQLDPNLKGIIHMEVAYYFESYETMEQTQEKEEEVNEDESEG
ncbi:cell division protein FtsQ [Bacillus mesophilus]|uniref:Cell division protein DivIB n=1 Tax=Bacillus mesophilus TaxID=1808955 RepID=A0A6M0Q239_9BACI|nr:cell division protein FtsQ/DivIB [Bacillus mesophilus]MBM7659453.1 cell division protein FtsQ [Bacillus mesophilus]NEY70326.1 cell division protein FtsQ/DivIB [Bacillus mesophilus]